MTHVEKSACPWFLIGPLSFKWAFQILIVWLVQKAPSCFAGIELLWFIAKDTIEDIAAQLLMDEDNLNPTGKILILGALLYT